LKDSRIERFEILDLGFRSSLAPKGGIEIERFEIQDLGFEI